MGPDFQIIQNTSHHLRVSSPQMLFWSGTYLTLAFEVVASLAIYKLLSPRAASTRGILHPRHPAPWFVWPRSRIALRSWLDEHARHQLGCRNRYLYQPLSDRL